MSAKHRKASKLAAKRTAVAATAVGATAAIGMMGAPAQAATATPPDYSKAISDYSHALDNFLNASNNVNGSFNSVWNPLASQTGGVLPTFTSSFSKVDGTDIRNLPTILTTIANLTLPGNVPAATPQVIVAGQTIGIDLPTAVPGKSLILTAAGLTQTGLDVLDAIPVGNDKTALDLLPPLSTLVNGLEFTQSNYSSGYNWGLLGMNGATHVVNTFLKTPDGIKTNPFTIPLGIPGIPISLPIAVPGVSLIGPDVIPYGTIWVPQADGTYNFPLDSKIGWWAAMPTAAVKLPTSLGGSQTVIAAPIYAGGVQLPFKMLSVGGLGANVLLPTSNGVYSPISVNMTNVQSVLPFGLTNLNVTTGNYVGTNGFYYDNGQNLLLLNNPIAPIPLIYGLGGANFGVDGVGIQSPSLFGIKLFSDLQLGKPVGPDNPAGLIPVDLLPSNPMNTILTAVTGSLGVGSLTQLLGIDSLILDPLTGALTPVYQGFSSIALKPISDLATQQYGPFVNGSASQLLDLSKTLSQQTANLPGAPNTAPPVDSGATQNKSAPAGINPLGANMLTASDTTNETVLPPVTEDKKVVPDHQEGPGKVPARDLLARFQPPSNTNTNTPQAGDSKVTEPEGTQPDSTQPAPSGNAGNEDHDHPTPIRDAIAGALGGGNTQKEVPTGGGNSGGTNNSGGANESGGNSGGGNNSGSSGSGNNAA